MQVDDFVDLDQMYRDVKPIPTKKRDSERESKRTRKKRRRSITDEYISDENMNQGSQRSQNSNGGFDQLEEYGISKRKVKRSQQQKLNNESKISLSKVRLAGSGEVVRNLEGVKRATIEHDLDDTYVSKQSSKVDMMTIKNIAAGSHNDNSFSMQNNYNTDGGLMNNNLAGQAQINIPLAKKKKKRKVLVIRKRGQPSDRDNS